MRKYELVFVADPRMPDEDVVGMVDGFKELIESKGATVVRQESWGKKKLAYPIQKLTEGKYNLFEIDSEDGELFVEVQQRLEQNDHVIRYLTVRLDAGRLRLREPAEGEAEAEGEADDTPAAEEEN